MDLCICYMDTVIDGRGGHVRSLQVEYLNPELRLPGESDQELAERLRPLVCWRSVLDSSGRPKYVNSGHSRRRIIEAVPLDETFILHKASLPQLITNSPRRMRAAVSIAQGIFEVDELKARELFAEAAWREATRLDVVAEREEAQSAIPQKKVLIANYRKAIGLAKAKMIAAAQTKTIQELIDYGNPWPARP